MATNMRNLSVAITVNNSIYRGKLIEPRNYDEDGYPVTTWQEPQQDHTRFEGWWDDLCRGDAYKDHS